MRDNFTYYKSGDHGRTGRWPMGKTGRRSPKLKYPKIDILELAVIERLVNLRGMDGELRIWYFRPRTEKVARCRLFDPAASHKSLEERVQVALAGSPYSLLGVSREYEYGWPWIIEVVKAPGEQPGADSPFAGLGGPLTPAQAELVSSGGCDAASVGFPSLLAGAVSHTAPADSSEA